MNTELNPSTSVNDPIHPPVESGVTRRSFVKRTAATILMTALAVNAFAKEVVAANGGDSSPPKYTILLTQADGTVSGETTWFSLWADENRRVKVTITVQGIDATQVNQKKDSWAATATIKAEYERFKDTTWIGKAPSKEHTLSFTASIPDEDKQEMNITAGGGESNGSYDLRLGTQIERPEPCIKIAGGTVTFKGLAGVDSTGGVKNIGVKPPGIELTWEAAAPDRSCSKPSAFGFSVVKK